MSEEKHEQLIAKALAPPEPRVSDEDFAARLMHRIRVEKALTPSPTNPRRPLLLWGGIGALAATTCLMLIAIFNQAPPVAPPDFNAQLVELVSLHRGQAMVARATEDSLLFVTAPEQPLRKPGQIRVLQADEVPAEGSTGWIRITRSDDRS